MRKIFSIALLTLALGARASAQTETASTPGQSRTPIVATPAIPQAQEAENATPITSTESLLIPVIDSSPSVRSYWSQMRRAAKEIIQDAPDQTSFAVVGIDAEAVKSQVFAPSRKAEALAFIDGLKIGGTFTDLWRGSDAALALIQQANPSSCVLVFLTDGRLTVPKSFRNKSSFFDLLRREFVSRRNITVLVVNVGGDKSAERESLPPNVKIVSLKSADELRASIERILTPTIKQTLAVEPPTVQAAATLRAPARRNYGYLMGAIGATLLLIIAVAVVARKRARSKERSEITADAPANLLRPEELAPPEPEEIAEAVVLVTAERVDERTGRRALAQRSLVSAGGHIVVGNSSFADLILEGLKQPQALQIGFDGKAVRVCRLRPQGIGELDNVWLNQQPAPIQFNMTDKDTVTIGSLSIKLLITTEDAVPSSLVRSETKWRVKPDQAPPATSRRIVG